MTTYICKCGRQVSKSTNADNTGNRDTAGCEGCPYLLPWGPTAWDDTRHAVVTDVKGYECRMSPELSYITELWGRVDDKCTMQINSLDFDFLERVSEWIKERYPNGELSGGFNRAKMRACEFVAQGRYRTSIYCTQNKAGMAAKAALVAAFFDPTSKTRLDIDPAAEMQVVLDAIEAGKAAAQQGGQKKEINMEVTYKGPTGWLYRASERPDAKGEYYIEYRDPAASAVYKPLPGYHHNANRDAVVSQLAGLIKELGLQAVMMEEPPANPAPTPEKPKGSGVWLYGDHRAMRVGVGNDTDRSDCRYYHVLVLNLLTDKPCWRKLSGAGNYDYKHLADADAELRETLPEDAHELTATEAKQLFTSPSTGIFELKPNIVKVWDEIMANAAPPAADIAAPVFDYEGLDAQTVATLHSAEDMIRGARKEYVIKVADAVGMVHDELVANCEGHNQHSEETFIAWCRSVGLGKDTAYRLLQVSDLLSSSTPNEQKVLEQASPSLLYAAAKPSAPAELVEGVKAGDITTHKQYRELEAQLKAEREGRETAEREKREALAWKQHAEGQAEDAKAAIHAAQQTAQEAQRTAETLKQQIYRRNEELQEKEQALNAVLDQQGEYIAKIRELEKRPKDVDVVVQQPSEAEIERWRKEGEERARAALAGQAPTVPTLNDCLPMSRDMAENIRTTQKLFFMAVSSLPVEEKTRCIEPLLDAVNELSAMLSASLNDTNFEEEASPFD